MKPCERLSLDPRDTLPELTPAEARRDLRADLDWLEQADCYTAWERSAINIATAAVKRALRGEAALGVLRRLAAWPEGGEAPGRDVTAELLGVVQDARRLLGGETPDLFGGGER